VAGVLTATVGAQGGSQRAQFDAAIWPLTIWPRARRFLAKAHATNGTKAAHIAIRPNEIPVATI
jgi:hypothetical protein